MRIERPPVAFGAAKLRPGRSPHQLLGRPFEPSGPITGLIPWTPPASIAARPLVPHTPCSWPGRPSLLAEHMMSADVVPPLAANMNAAFKKVRGAIGGPDDDDLRELIVDRIVELANDGVYDVEELSSRTLRCLNPHGSRG